MCPNLKLNFLTKKIEKMKKFVLLVAIIATVFCANAHNFDSLVAIKSPGLNNFVLTYTPVPAVRTDTVWWCIGFGHDSDRTISPPYYGLLNVAILSSVHSTTVDISGSDTNVCWAFIAAYRRDISTGLFVYDTTTSVVMSKFPTIVDSLSSTFDTVHYFLSVKGGNNNGVILRVKKYSDSSYSYGSLYQQDTINGPGVVAVNGVIPADTCSPVYLEFTLSNSITGTDTVRVVKMTQCPLPAFTSLVYAELVDSSTTDDSLKFNFILNTFGRNAICVVKVRKVTDTMWSDVIPITSFDTSVTGLQTVSVNVSGLTPLTLYAFEVDLMNVNGPTVLGTYYIKTKDTVLGTSGTFGIGSVSISINNSTQDSIIYYVNCTLPPGSISNLIISWLFNGNQIDEYPVSVSTEGVYRFAFACLGNGTYGAFGWATNTITSGYQTADTLSIGYTKNSAGVAVVANNKNVHGKVIFVDDQLGIKNSEQECMFGEIYKFAPKQIQCAYYFISDDGQFTDCQKIFVH